MCLWYPKEPSQLDSSILGSRRCFKTECKAILENATLHFDQVVFAHLELQHVRARACVCVCGVLFMFVVSEASSIKSSFKDA